MYKQVLMYCFSVLQEVPIQLLLHSQSHLHHMVAVISYNLAQVSSLMPSYIRMSLF